MSTYICPLCNQHILACIYLNKNNPEFTCNGCVALPQFKRMDLRLKPDIQYIAKAFYLNCLSLALMSIDSIDKNVIVQSLNQATHFSAHMRQIVETVDLVGLIVGRHGGHLFGGVVRALVLYVKRIDCPVELQQPVLNDHLQIQDLSNMALSYREPIEPLIQEDFKDIDVWFKNKDDWTLAWEALCAAGFQVSYVFATDDQKDRNEAPDVSCPEFQLGQFVLARQGVELYLDVVCADQLPVNDFACNTLTARYIAVQGQQRTIEWSSQQVGHQFTADELIQQCLTKRTYILPQFPTVQANEDLMVRINVSMRTWYPVERLNGFELYQKFTFVNKDDWTERRDKALTELNNEYMHNG